MGKEISNQKFTRYHQIKSRVQHAAEKHVHISILMSLESKQRNKNTEE